MLPPRLRNSRSLSRPFYATVLVISLLTAYSFLGFSQHHGRNDASTISLAKRDKADCNEVHSVRDQCSFVRRNCMDADAGLLPYLEFYYCHLQHARPVAFILLVVWLGLLFTTIGIAASDFFSVNLSTISAILGLSQSLAGVTFLAFGNGSPDVFSTFAAMGSNSPSMAVGELLGAASFITGVVAGSMALVREFRVDRATYTRDICFFIVAVGFTMAFLADGKLRFWECWAMIGYYLIYVVFVVSCHWRSVRKKRRLRREGEARSHFYAASSQSADELAGEPYRDDPDDVDRGPGQTPRPGSVVNGDGLCIADETSRPDPESQVPHLNVPGHAEDSDCEHERIIAAEVTRNMRVVRTGAKRHNSINPIRPSLVGALEFRSALAQLQRESNHQLFSIPGRSYSENCFGGRARRGTVAVGPETDAAHFVSHGDSLSEAGARGTRRERALSSGDAPLPPDMVDGYRSVSGLHLRAPGGTGSSRRAPHLKRSHTAEGSPTHRRAVSRPRDDGRGGQHNDGPSDEAPPNLRLQIPNQPAMHARASPPRSPHIWYSDSPAILTPSAYSERGQFIPSSIASVPEEGFPELQTTTPSSRRIRWWPYSVLPSPHALLAALFPTLRGWRDKTAWDKFLSAISVPSIFLLVITLPVVDSEVSEDATSTEGTVVGDTCPTPTLNVVAPKDDDDEHERGRSRGVAAGGSIDRAQGPAGLTPLVSQGAAEESLAALRAECMLGAAKGTPDLPCACNVEAKPAPPTWNRWLVCLQLFTGPLFASFVLWANLREDWQRPWRELLRMVLISLVTSLVLLAVLLATTTEHSRPRFHYLLCFLGFIISIAWISTIAGEVVGVLKAFGVILGISEALLGLTIFAAGNSIGDLVANITVARLGYPVMALSACFGGPMLNILLGIGIGGVMMMAQQGKKKHAKHPERPLQYGPYHVQVGGTLMVSCVTLLTILFLLLVLVPLNRWVLSRRIGWGIITLWAVSTVVSVVIEVTGAFAGSA